LQVDWGQIVTHIIGFAIALWILRRYAWGPILGLIEERQERVRRERAAAEEARRDIEGLRRELEERLRGIDAQARQKLTEAVAEGQRVAAEMKENSRAEAQGLIARAREEIGRERDQARVALRDEMVGLALAAAEKVVSEKMDATRDRELVRNFLDEVERLT
jgi:F-type H+-transporting ATPase subunit b